MMTTSASVDRVPKLRPQLPGSDAASPYLKEIVMLRKAKIAVVAALIATSASAALARPTFVPIAPHAPQQCMTDEGQGRFDPCNGGS
jgi:hypothetical protein